MQPETYILHPAIRPPGRLVPPYPWIGHIPFLQWLIAEMRPRTYVELGVHAGNSFCAAAEVLAALSPKGKAFAIDCWEGDHQAGYYQNDVFTDFKRHVDVTFPDVVTVLRRRFAEAAPAFEAGSVDLLHIDGLHTYEAVSEDFLTWLPKMSTRGVILFHDIAERMGDFGVWKLWAEVAERYPSLSFDHNHGLGVLLTGPDVPQTVRDITGFTGQDRDLVKKIFEMHGGNVYRVAVAECGTRAESEAARADRLQQLVDAMESSQSWRLTKPLRAAKALAARLSLRPTVR
jgi:hypothetical protein